MTITAALVEEPGGDFVVHDNLTIADPGPGEVLVRITAVGICHTDLSSKAMWPGELLPMVFGHEGAGTVEAVGDGVTTVAPGDTVALSYRSCGSCDQCLAGHHAYCDQFRLLNSSGGRGDGTTPLSRDGEPVSAGFFGQSSFASYAVTYESNTVKVPASVPPEIAAPMGCSVQTGVGAVFNALEAQETESFVLFGAGPVGLAGVMAAVAVGCSPVIVVDPVKERRDLAAELGATHTIDPTTEDDVVGHVRELTGSGADTALDTTAIPAVMNQALSGLRARGRCAVVGIGAPELTVDITAFISRGLTLRGVIEGDATPVDMLPTLVELYQAGKLPMEKLITTYPFRQINQAVGDAATGRTVKAVLTF